MVRHRISGRARRRRRLMSEPLLLVENVSVRFGGIVALDRVSFAVARGHIVGLIGPNGAGKTTMFNCLSRLYAFSEGRIAFEGRSLLETPPHGIAALGIGRTFQNLALFRTMTVRQNVLLGGHARSRQRLRRQRPAPAERAARGSAPRQRRRSPARAARPRRASPTCR